MGFKSTVGVKKQPKNICQEVFFPEQDIAY